MKSKLAVYLLLALFSLVTCVPSAVAWESFSSIGSSGAIKISASGVLPSANDLIVSVLDSTGISEVGVLTFNCDGSELVVTAPQVVKIAFNASSPGYKTIIVSTDNGDNAAGDNILGAGLIGSENNASVPLHWAVFEELPSAGYAFDVNDDGNVDNTVHPYVVDRGQRGEDGTITGKNGFDTVAVLNYAAVVWGIKGTSASLASAPYGSGEYAKNEAGETYELAREVTDGVVYVKFAADYNGADGQAYSTNTLSFDLITVS